MSRRRKALVPIQVGVVQPAEGTRTAGRRTLQLLGASLPVPIQVVVDIFTRLAAHASLSNSFLIWIRPRGTVLAKRLLSIL